METNLKGPLRPSRQEIGLGVGGLVYSFLGSQPFLWSYPMRIAQISPKTRFSNFGNKLVKRAFSDFAQSGSRGATTIAWHSRQRSRSGVRRDSAWLEKRFASIDLTSPSLMHPRLLSHGGLDGGQKSALAR